MATFSKRQANSIFDKVPEELATKIFELATANCRPNAANCRLVSQYFHTHSSPYLLPKIVIAARLDALTKVRDILQHPYFSQHVTHLLWDASLYDSELATTWDYYRGAFQLAIHTSVYKDPAFSQLRETDDATEYELRGVERTASSSVSDDFEDDYVDDLSRGLHISFSNYFRRWRNQEKIYPNSYTLDEEKTEETNLARHYFFRAIRELPQLHHISYGDYRALAYEGEGYAELCRRLFGNMVCPSLNYLKSYNQTHLKTFLKDLAEHHPTWRSLSIGRQPFERSPIDGESVPGVLDSVDSSGNKYMMMECQSLFPSKEGQDSPKIQAKALRLPLLDSDCGSRMIERLIRSLGAGIVDLEIGSHRFLDEIERSRGHITTLSSSDPLNTIIALQASDLDALKSLSLRGLTFDILSLKKGLSKCAKTLRILRLKDCYCRETYEAFEAFAKDELKLTLALTGVEIHSLIFKDSTSLALNLPYEPSFGAFRAIYHGKIASTYGIDGLDSRARTMDHQEIKEIGAYWGYDLLAGWPYERYELEDAMLGGRVNTIVRQVLSVSVRDEARWWDEPASYK